jgi:NAD(P)-dependent dehydrogenase (short-subunit alcohol dehydrogenase family)
VTTAFDLAGRVAVVTGGGRGLGRAMAEGLATAGAAVVVTSRTEARNQEVAEAIRVAGGRALGVVADVRDPDQIASAFSRAREAFGRVDILVNNAGVSPVYKYAEDVTPAEWETIVDTNLRGVFFAAQVACRFMRDSGGGRIINVASAAGAEGTPRLSVYGATKAGVINLTRTLALEWQRHGILVNAIAPGFFEVGVGEPLLESHHRERILARIPLGRVGTKAEIAGIAVFLASDASSYMTGQTVFVDGGWLA